MPLKDDRELDCSALFHLLIDWEVERGIIEQCFSNNDLVEMGGKIIAVAELVGCRVEKVSVARWKKSVFGHVSNVKQEAIDLCQRLYPNADILRPTPKGRKMNPDHNRADAVLMCHHLRRTLLG